LTLKGSSTNLATTVKKTVRYQNSRSLVRSREKENIPMLLHWLLRRCTGAGHVTASWVFGGRVAVWASDKIPMICSFHYWGRLWRGVCISGISVGRAVATAWHGGRRGVDFKAGGGIVGRLIVYWFDRISEAVAISGRVSDRRGLRGRNERIIEVERLKSEIRKRL
jgi:hypothetical protein